MALVAEREWTIDRLELEILLALRRLSDISEQRLYDFFSYKGLPRSEELRNNPISRTALTQNMAAGSREQVVSSEDVAPV